VNDHMPSPPQLTDRSGVTDAVRTQILATEHWSLLATRSMTWNEVFSRASMFVTVLSAAMVALALVAQVTAFGQTFRVFALLVLPIVLLVGLSTLIRLAYCNAEDGNLVLGMNRLRHAYLEMAPELERYFVTGHHDDAAGYLKTWGHDRFRFAHFLAGTPNVVAAILAVLVGVYAGLVADALGATDRVDVIGGVAGGLAFLVVFLFAGVNLRRQVLRAHPPLFPTEDAHS
jgi:uncharacterized membrane protein